MISDYLKIASLGITHRQLRSWLTIIGIVIGIGAIVSLVLVSRGLENAVTAQFEEFGGRLVTVVPTDFAGPGTGGRLFTEKDAEVVERAAGIDYAVPLITGSAKIAYKGEEEFTMILGWPAETAERASRDMNFELESGRFSRKGETGGIVIGYDIAHSLFDSEINIRDRLEVNDEKYKVIGIVERIGNQQDDSQIYFSLDEAREVLDEPEKVNFIMAIVKTGEDVPTVAERVEKELDDYRDDDDFSVFTAEQILEQIGEILAVVSFVLVGIAGISLIVGSVGIMNTMYTSVLERTREIGVMKAIGASNEAVLLIFVMESGLLGLVGGVVGALGGAGLAVAIGKLSEGAALPIPLLIIVDPYIVVGGIVLAFFLGAISGFLPARSASKLKPADALTFE